MSSVFGDSPPELITVKSGDLATPKVIANDLDSLKVKFPYGSWLARTTQVWLAEELVSVIVGPVLGEPSVQPLAPGNKLQDADGLPFPVGLRPLVIFNTRGTLTRGVPL